MPNQKNIKNVEQLVDKLAKAKSIYFTDYLGLNVSEVTALRKKFFENNVEYLVVKNTLLKIASQKNDINLSEELLHGSTAIALSYDEPVAAAKVIKGFLKDHDLPTVKGLVFEGDYHAAGQFEKFANWYFENKIVYQEVCFICVFNICRHAFFFTCAGQKVDQPKKMFLMFI